MQADPDSYRLGYLKAIVDAKSVLVKEMKKPDVSLETVAELFKAVTLLDKELQGMYEQEAPELIVKVKI